MKKPVFVALVCLFLLVQGVSAYNEIRVGDNMFITIPKDEYFYITVFIPDDLGVVSEGKIDYLIESTADPEWDDLTTQIVRRELYNMATIRIEFSAKEKFEYSCSGPFQIKLSSEELGKSRTWSGEVCVSDRADIDTVPEGSETSGMGNVNDNIDLFDADFMPSEKIASPGEDVEFTLSIESYADLDFDITLGDELDMSSTGDSVSTSSSNPRKDVTVTVKAPDTLDTYDFTAKVEAECGEQFCERTVKGRLIVADSSSIPDTYYTLSMFPNGLNIKDIEPIDYEITIHNPGNTKAFDLELAIPDEFTTDFDKDNVTVGAGEDYTYKFTVTPSDDFGFEIIRFYASYGEKRKMATAQVSENEMLSDTEREAEDLLSRADGETAGEINSAMSEWNDAYSSSEYGDEFSEYGTIKDRLKAASDKLDDQTTDDTNGDDLIIISEPEDENPLSNPLILAVIIIVPIAAIAGFVLYKRSRTEDIDKMEF